MRSMIVATALFLSLVASANAEGDLASEDWAGFYIGGQVGGGTAQSDWTIQRRSSSRDVSFFEDDGRIVREVSTSSSINNGKGSGDDTFAAVGGFLGINAMLGSILVGGQLEGNLTNNETAVDYLNTEMGNEGEVSTFSDSAISSTQTGTLLLSAGLELRSEAGP